MNRSRRLAVAIVAAVGLAAVAVVLVFALGVRNVPRFPTLDEQPDPRLSGSIAYTTWGDDRGRCLWVAEIGAAPRQFGCELDGSGKDEGYVGWFGFDEAGHLLLARYPGGAAETGTLTTYDRTTFAVLGARALTADDRPPDRTTRADGARLRVERVDAGEWELQVVAAGSVRVVRSFRGPDDYFLGEAFWSPDGEWIVVMDSTGGPGRYLVLAAEADTTPRVLVSDAGELQWHQGQS